MKKVFRTLQLIFFLILFINQCYSKQTEFEFKIIKVKKNSLIANKGSEHGITINSVYDIIHVNSNDRKIVGQAKVVIIREKICGLKVIKLSSNLNIVTGDLLTNHVEKSTEADELLNEMQEISSNDEYNRGKKETEKHEIERILRGPIPGYTYTAKPGNIMVGLEYAKFSTQSFFDETGKKFSYDESYEDIIDPIGYFEGLDLHIEYSIDNDFGLFIDVPYITRQEFDWNADPGYGYYFNNLNGETGTSDINIGGWILLSQTSYSRLMTIIDYKFASGSSPYDIEDDSWSSTGTGQTDFGFSLLGDCIIDPSLLTSFGGSYVIRNKGSFSSEGYSWNEKPGNQLQFSCRLATKLSSKFSTGLSFLYSFQWDNEINGEVVEDSGYESIDLIPLVGLQLMPNKMIVNLIGKYYYPLSGKFNYISWKGLSVGIQIFF